MSVDLADVNRSVHAVGKDVRRVREDIQTVLDNQAMLVALFRDGEYLYVLMDACMHVTIPRPLAIRSGVFIISIFGY